MESKYVKAVDQLVFSENLMGKIPKNRSCGVSSRKIRAAALAAALIVLMATSAFGVASAMRERPGKVEQIGTVTEPMTDAEIMEFRVSEGMEGVAVHYMELEANKNYYFRHGMLWTERSYQRLTEDYRLEPMELKKVDAQLQKNDRVYKLTFDYLDTDKGVISNHRSVYHKNENGEILLCATDGRSGQWAVWLNVETGEIRDALPEWQASDFVGRVGYAEPLRGGILISTVVEDSAIVDETTPFGEDYGQRDNSYNLNYWIAPGAKEAKIIRVPEGALDYVENDTIYYHDISGKLFVLDENFEFRQLSGYLSTDQMQDGLMTVSVWGKLGILDAFNGETYVFDELEVQPWYVDDYDALRYGSTGTIALVQTDWRHDPERIVLTKLGMLDYETGELKLLTIENDYDGYRHAWLDENRFAGVYTNGVRQFLCVYEFEK
jgi:hypothetical protein